jgi:hypothetical protein
VDVCIAHANVFVQERKRGQRVSQIVICKAEVKCRATQSTKKVLQILCYGLSL